jgi:two-component system sensor histidine kinase/response regulator
VGIDSEYVTKLFDITQVNTALGEAAEKGTTSGLLLCKEYVNKHGGEIWVKSDRGKGCTFKFTLPLFNED